MYHKKSNISGNKKLIQLLLLIALIDSFFGKLFVEIEKEALIKCFWIKNNYTEKIEKIPWGYFS